MRLSVVIPAYNEQAILAETLRRVSVFCALKSGGSEILISTDGSTDGSDAIVEGFKAAHPKANVRLIRSETNRGKGAAVRAGVLAASGDYVLVTDADLSTPVKESDKLIEAIGSGALDGAIGSRALRLPLPGRQAGAGRQARLGGQTPDVQQSFRRWLSGRIFNLFVSALALPDYRDTQCGFKCFRLKAARELFSAQKLDGFSFDVEVLLLAKRRGMKIKEVPVMWRQGRRSSVSLVRDASRMVRDLFKLRHAR